MPHPKEEEMRKKTTGRLDRSLHIITYFYEQPDRGGTTVFHTISESTSKYPWMNLFLIPTIDAQGTPGDASC
jgi:hypothetical protein